jgi:C4-dicarboxylate-specific signal transduction histidine kinase
LPRLFEPFYTSKSQGIGLGLHVSQKIMREHGGCMEVSSGEREGTAFALRFKQEDSDGKLVDRR